MISLCVNFMVFVDRRNTLIRSMHPNVMRLILTDNTTFIQDVVTFKPIFESYLTPVISNTWEC
jgi:hypothetical protein